MNPLTSLEIAPRTFPVTRADLIAYAEASGDHNPIHQDEEVALRVGLPGVIAHGMFTLALVARYLREQGVPAEEVLEIGAKFVKPVVVPADGAEVSMSAVTQASESGTEVTVEVLCDGVRIFGPRGARVRLRG